MLVTDVQVHGILTIQAPCRLEEPRHERLIFCLGEGGLLIGDAVSLAVAEGQCVYIPRPIVLRTNGHMRLVQITCSVYNQELARRLGDDPCILSIPNLSVREIIFNMLWEYNRKAAFFQDSASLGLIRLLFAAVVEQSGHDQGLLLQREAFTDPLLRLGADYIDGHLSDEDVLDQVCAVINRNQAQLNYIFKKYSGLTALQWLHHRRLLKSKELLCFSSYTITEIAEMTGFKSIHYFSRYFKKKELITPQKFREALLPGILL